MQAFDSFSCSANTAFLPKKEEMKWSKVMENRFMQSCVSSFLLGRFNELVPQFHDIALIHQHDCLT